MKYGPTLINGPITEMYPKDMLFRSKPDSLAELERFLHDENIQQPDLDTMVWHANRNGWYWLKLPDRDKPTWRDALRDIGVYMTMLCEMLTPEEIAGRFAKLVETAGLQEDIGLED